MLKDRVGPSEIIIEIQPYKVEPDIKFEIQITAMKTNMKCKTLSEETLFGRFYLRVRG